MMDHPTAKNLVVRLTDPKVCSEIFMCVLWSFYVPFNGPGASIFHAAKAMATGAAPVSLNMSRPDPRAK